MTDSSDARPPISQDSSSLNPSAAHSAPNAADLQITLTLPPEVVAALQQASQQSSGQPLSQQIVALLQQAVGLQQEAQPSDSERSLRQELEQLKQQLSLLEALLPRVELVESKIDRLFSNPAIAQQASVSLPAPVPASGLDSAEVLSDDGKALDPNGNPGSAVASIWMQVQQNDRPPASIPSTLQPTEPCPKCQQRLMPFKSLGKAVCIGCGWTNQPRSEASMAADAPDVDIHRLLEQAAVESLENMKPRKRST